MTGRAIGVAVLLLAFLAPSVGSQSIVVGRLRGRVMENGSPIRRLVEVRLENEAAVLIDTAYTQGSDEFNFPGLQIDLNTRYFLIIREPGFTEVRHQLEINRGPFGVVEFGLVNLYLNTLPPEDEPSGSTDTVDLRQLTAEIPDEAHDAYQDALGHLDEGDSDAALSSLELAVRLAPQHYDALNTLAVEYLNGQRYGDAKQTFERAYDLNQNDPILLTNLGTLHFQEGELLEQLAQDSPELDRAGESYLEAVAYLQDAMRLDPASARIAFYLGSALYKTGAYDEAEETLFVAMDNDPDMGESRLALINVYVNQDRPEAALAQIELYLETFPDSPQREALERARNAIRAAIGR
jgi:Tfp pilus assembly protein PilF